MKIFESLFLGLIVLMLYMILVMAPVAIYTDAKCLEKGYPEFRVTIGLEKYCMNYDGSITMKVDKL